MWNRPIPALQIAFGDVLAFPRGEFRQSINIGLHGLFVLLCKPDLVTAQQGQVEKAIIMGGEDKLGVVRIDGSILYHLDQMSGQKRVHAFRLIMDVSLMERWLVTEN